MTTTPTPAAAQAEMLPCLDPQGLCSHPDARGRHASACPAAYREPVAAALQALMDEKAELKIVADTNFKEWQRMFGLVLDRDAKLASLEAENARLRTALEPFRVRHMACEAHYSDDHVDRMVPVYMSDLRKA